MPVTLSPDAPSVTEGGALTFTVAAAPGDDETIAKPLSWVVLDGSGEIAAGGDFAAASGKLPPLNPDHASRVFAVAVAADELFEGPETYTVEVRSDAAEDDPASGALEASAAFAVEDGDAAPAYSIADAAPVTEGGELAFTVTASTAAAGDQTVSYRVDGGEAQTLTIPAGATAAAIRVPTEDNADQGDNPAVVVELLSASVGTASGAAAGLVEDDERASVYSVSGGAAAEGGVLEFTVERTGGKEAETVAYSLGGGATAGIDYAAPPSTITLESGELMGTVSFEAGELARTIQVQTLLDTAPEADETVLVALVAASDGGIVEEASAAGTVTDLALAGVLRRQVVVEPGPDGTVSPSAEVLRFADGWVDFDGGTGTGSALRLYQATLGRAPDPIGLGFWTDALEAGTASLPQAAEGFVASPEFQATYGVLDNGAFVDLLYLNVLGRAGDPEGAAHWTGALDAGAATRAEVVLGFSESVELVSATSARFAAGVWAADPVAVDAMRYYETVLDRLPDAGGLAFWIGARGQGLTLAQMADAFTGSAEFEARYGALGDRGFVEQLYLNALDRPGDEEGIAHWTGALDAGALSRAEVVADFAFSHEMAVKLTPYTEDGIIFA
jgi:hypothetical protein